MNMSLTPLKVSNSQPPISTEAQKCVKHKKFRAMFFCDKENVYLCEKCNSEHEKHSHIELNQACEVLI
jgi:hypothetical protein